MNWIAEQVSRRYRDAPVLVVGAGRSGTSILLQALGEHPEILSSDRESPLIQYFGMLMHPLEFGPFAFGESKEYHRAELKVPVEYLYDNLRRLCLEVALGGDHGLSAILRRRRSPWTIRRWCAKGFPNRDEAAGLLRLFPKLRLLHIHRNGIDVVHSRSKFRGMKRYEFSDHCDIWAKHVEKFGYLFDTPEALPVRHEDLLKDPGQTFRDVLTFLGLRHDAGPERFARSTLIHSLDKKTQTGVDVHKALRERESPYGQWTADQRKTFREICGAGMSRLKYEIPS
jgi:hypothetical protein